MTLELPWRMMGWGGAAALLLVPLIAAWPWTGSDYVFAAVLMGSVGVGLELAFRKSGSVAFRAAAALALLAGLLLIWINGAVGIIGSEDEPANLLFAVVVVLALLGSLAARFRPSGMAIAMGLAAVAQLLVPFAAAIFQIAPAELLLRREVPMLTLFFVGVWATSAALFRRASHHSSR